MNGQLYNLLRIASYSNHHLIDTPFDFPEEKYIGSIQFIDNTKTRCTDLIEWQSDLKSKQCHRVYVKLIVKDDDRNKSGFVNASAGQFLICDFLTYFEIWRNDFEIVEGKWQVTYRLVKTIQECFKTDETPYLDVLNKTIKAYNTLAHFASDIDETHWSKFFITGYDNLMGYKEKQVFEIYQLVELIQWPFGAMGSWNDSPFYSAHEKNRSDDFDLFSDRLFVSIHQLLEATINVTSVN